MKNPSLPLILPVVLLVGCAYLRPLEYIQPSNDNAMTFSVKKGDGGNFKFDNFFLDVAPYAMAFANSEKCTGPIMLPGTQLLTTGVKLPAGKPIAITIGIGTGGLLAPMQACRVYFRFTPDAGSQYSAYLSVDSGKCSISVKANNQQFVSIEKLQALKPWDTTGEYCANQ